MNLEQEKFINGRIALYNKSFKDTLFDEYCRSDFDLSDLSSIKPFWKEIYHGADPERDKQEDILIINQPYLNAKEGCLCFIIFGAEKALITYKNGEEKSLMFQMRTDYKVPVAVCDFTYDNPIITIIFKFGFNIIDDIKINVNTIIKEEPLVDNKNVLDKKLKANMNMSVATGVDLINVYFQPCSSDYSYTKVEFYKDGKNLAKYKIDGEVFFWCIPNLAFGSYEIKIAQYNKNDAVLVESEMKSVTLKLPNYSGMHVITNC